MAYKFQIGAAIQQGASTYIGKIDSTAGELAGVNVSGSGDEINVHGTNANVQAGGAIAFNNADQLLYKHNGNENKISIDAAAQKPSMTILMSGSNSRSIVELKNATGNDFYLELFSGSHGDGVEAGWNLNKGATLGSVSGSGNLNVLNNADFNGVGTVQGNLTVNGTNTTLTSTQVEIKDKVLQVDYQAADDAASQGSGFLFGQASQAYGGNLIYASSSAQQRHIAFRNSNGVGIPVKAAQFIGDGSGLENATANNIAFAINEVQTKASAPFAAVNTAQAGRTNIVVNSLAGTQVLMLPGTGSVTAGQVIKIKLQRSATATNFVRITPQGSDVAAIDGNTVGLEMMSPSASVELVYLGVVDSTGSFAIF